MTKSLNFERIWRKKKNVSNEFLPLSRILKWVILLPSWLMVESKPLINFVIDVQIKKKSKKNQRCFSNRHVFPVYIKLYYYLHKNQIILHHYDWDSSISLVDMLHSSFCIALNKQERKWKVANKKENFKEKKKGRKRKRTELEIQNQKKWKMKIAIIFRIKLGEAF